MADTLADVRRKLTEARSELRLAQDDWHAARLRAELALGDKVEWDTKRLGTNAEDRKRAFDAAVEGDEDCMNARAALRSFESHVGYLEAELDCLLDTRREREWAVRLRFADLMEGGQTSEIAPDPVTLGIQEPMPL